MFADITKATEEFYDKTLKEMDETIDNIGSLLPGVEEHNPGLIDEMLKILQG